MTLLSPLALLFALTAAVPLILHLYQRRHRSVIVFSTNRFFTASVIRSQRRLQLQRLLLLVLRMAACGFLALALARPVLTWSGIIGGEPGTRDLVILLDDSLSMQAVDAVAGVGVPSTGRQGLVDRERRSVSTRRQQTRFDRARDLALQTLDELAAHDRAAIITFTGRALGHESRAGLTPTDNLLMLTDELEQMRPTFAAGDAFSALQTAARVLEHSERRTRLMVVLSDFQDSDWRRGGWPQPLHPVATAYIDVGPPAFANVSADQLLLSQASAIVEQPNLLRLRLINHDRQTRSVELALRVDGVEQLRRTVELVAQSPRIEHLPVTFDTPGLHRLTLDILHRDALAADNTLHATVCVNDRLPVLIISGDSDRPRDRSGAFYLRAAARAVSPDGESIQTDLIRPDALPGTTLDNSRVIVLSNVASLPLPQLERLERFVMAGGGLAIFLGNSADTDFYNNIMGAETRPLGGLMPGQIRALVGGREGELPLNVVEADLDHPILQRFEGALRGALAAVNIYRAHVVQPRAAWVLARLNDQAPLILQRNYGEGRVVLFTCPPQPTWTDLPLKGTFIPLVSRTLSYLAGGVESQRGVEVGRELTIGHGSSATETPIYVTKPDGVRVTARIAVERQPSVSGPRVYLPAAMVDRPGIYEIDRPPASDPRAMMLRAVNAPRCESSSTPVERTAHAGAAGDWNVTDVAPSGEGSPQRSIIAPLSASAAAGRGIWDMLLWVALAIVLLEPLIANRRTLKRVAPTRAVKRRAA